MGGEGGVGETSPSTERHRFAPRKEVRPIALAILQAIQAFDPAAFRLRSDALHSISVQAGCGASASVGRDESESVPKNAPKAVG